MMYETAADLEREGGIVQIICEAYKTAAFKMPQESRLDYILTKNGKVNCLIEIKSRKCGFGDYTDYMISKGKYDALVAHGSRLHLPSVIFVQWTDRLGFIVVPCEHTEGHGGRRDRNDIRDLEKMVYIPIDTFTWVDKSNEDI
jgi:hypothetical protein